MRTLCRLPIFALFLAVTGCANWSGIFPDDEDETEEDAADFDNDGIADVLLTPDHLLLGPGESQNIEVTMPDGGMLTDVESTLDHVHAQINGDHVRVTNEGVENASGRIDVSVVAGDIPYFESARVQTWDGNEASLFNELRLQVERGRLGGEPAELVAYDDAEGFHARLPSTNAGRYDIPLDVSLPFTHVSVVCEVPNAFGIDVEHLILAVPTDDDASVTVECISNIETHTVNGTLLNVPLGESAHLHAFDGSTQGSAVYSLSSVPANGDSEIVAWSSDTQLPNSFLYVPLGPAASVINIDFAGATPATVHPLAITGSGAITASVNLRTALYTTAPVSATIGTSFQFASSGISQMSALYGLEARNDMGGAYSARVEVGGAASIGDVSLPDADLGLAPTISSGPAIAFLDGGDRHYVALTQDAVFPDTRVVRFFSLDGDEGTFDYAAEIAGLSTLGEWDPAWELAGTGSVRTERIDLTTCSDRWTRVVSHPESRQTCTVDRLGWTGTF